MTHYEQSIRHLFIIQINGIAHRDTTIYTDQEFYMILDQYNGYLPENVLAFHFSLLDRPNRVVEAYPSISIPIYELTRQKAAEIPEGLRLYTKSGPRSGVPIFRRHMDFVWTAHDNPGGLIAYIDGKEHSLLSAYTAIPISFREAANYVNNRHRHNVAPQGHKFSIALQSVEGFIVGVLITSIPKSRYQNDGVTLEINRCCTDYRYHNVCSSLYGKAIRIGKEQGYT